MGEIADLVKQRESGVPPPGGNTAALVKQRELTHQKSFAAMTPEQELAATYGTLGPPGLPDLGLRADISLSKDFDVKMEKFTSAYPYGELRQDEKTGTTMFRKTPDDKWAKLDAGMFEKLELGDISDLAGDIPAIAGEILLTKGATRPISTLLRAGAGAGIGDIARSGAELARGYEAPSILPTAATEAALGAGGEALGLGARGTISALRGAGAATPKPFAGRVMQEARRAGLPQLHPGQATENPIIQAFARQSRALSGKIHDYERTQEGAALNLLEGMRRRGEVMPLGRDLEIALARRENEITRKLKSRAPGQLAPGDALKKGIETYRDMSGRAVSHAYAEARQVAEPGFDISNVLSQADKIGQGVSALQKSGQVGRVSEVPVELMGVIEQLKQLDPAAVADPRMAIESGASAPFDVLKELRTRLFDLQNPVDGVIRNENRLAGQLYRELSDTLKSPVGGGADFLPKWGKATKMAAKRFDTLEQEYITKALRAHKGGDVEGLFRSLFRPNNANQIKFVRETMARNGIDKWNDFREGAISDLVSSPYKMWGTLKSFDKETLGEIFTRPEVDLLEKTAYQFQRLDQSGVKEAVLRQTQASGVVSDLISGMNTAGADELFKMSGGRNTPLGQKVRAGIVDWVYNRSIERGKYGKQLNRKAVMNSVDTLRSAGMLKFLTNEDKRALHVVLPDYLSLVRGLGTDTGESIRRATIVQKLTDQPISALFDIAEEVGIGRVLTTKWGHDLIYGVGKKKWDMQTLRRFSGALAIMADDYEKEGQ